ncbi:MBL fold metallo-hydrolase [Isoalcanivorax beigongshangi]|uniref:MBL fold metallo-hydrolase n=1 Tax=Isoalcanivorax beigongshangi TaxID=3238810 RepID=A0ABV4AKC8_9GAMM
MFEMLAPDLGRLRLPVSFPPQHVNSYLLRDGDGWFVVDCGRHDEPTRAVWQQFLASPELGGGISRIFLTHTHPDHSGSAAWLSAQTGAPVLLAAAEWDWMQRIWARATEQPEQIKAFFAGWGAEPPQQQLAVHMLAKFRDGNPLMTGEVVTLAPGDSLTINGTRWSLEGGEGHTICNLLLHQPQQQRLITGDQVLPGIRPNVSIWYSMEHDALGDYLRSVARLAALPVAWAYPAHGDPFDNYAERCEQLLTFHRGRLGRTRELFIQQRDWRIEQLLEQLLGARGNEGNFLLKAGQLYAILRHLQQAGEVSSSQPGYWHYSA